MRDDRIVARHVRDPYDDEIVEVSEEIEPVAVR